MSIVPTSMEKYFVLEFKMEFMHYTMQARSQERRGGGLSPTRLKGTESAQNRKHTFLCYDLDCMLESMENNVKNHKNKSNI